MGIIVHGVMVGILLMASTPAAAVKGSDRLLLQPITREDWRDAGVGGTGCWWRVRNDKAWRFAMSDRIAVMRMGGSVVSLSPAVGARDVFPFTFDRWRADDFAVRVISTKAGRRVGAETLNKGARLIVTTKAGRSVFEGTLVCGS